MKVIIIGCNHAGTFASTYLKKLHSDVEVVTYDKSDNISFLACGIALWVGDVVKDPKGLFYASPESLEEQGIKVNMGYEISNIDFANKKIEGVKVADGTPFEDNYDKLILAAGSWPIVPRNIDGIDLKGIHLSKLYKHALDIIEELKKPETKRVMVVGAGYIGVEIIEALRQRGKETILVEALPRVMSNYFDEEITDVALEYIEKGGVEVHLDEKVIKFEGDANGHVNKVITDKSSYDVDMVIMSIGFRPNCELYKDHLETLQNGAILVDSHMQTSDPDVFAIGDCAAVYSRASLTREYIALATNAVRMGIVVAHNIKEKVLSYQGTQGSNAICIFGYNMASTGLSECCANKIGLKVKTNFVKDTTRPEFMPEYKDILVKVVYEEDTRRMVGAQIASEENHTEAIHAFSLAIQNGMSIDEFALSDFFFLPHYNKPVSWLTAVALTAK